MTQRQPSVDQVRVEEAPSDAELVAATQGGDRQAFGTLVERHQERLFNTLLRVLGSSDDAREVLQDAFIQAYTKIDTFRGSSQFYTWMYRVALNLACSYKRRTKRHREEVSIDTMKTNVGEEPVDHGESPEQDMLRAEQAELVQAALVELSDEHRQILVLREMDDFSYETIAEILELPVGTVRSRLFRARMQMKELLEVVLISESKQKG
ncbi:RNA polymerase sigma factor [Bythopirellula polymerisocia]|uniref:ECF RNA polymerase sigma-E factor n=1 Tax=Bythopirellula polymerisocia TaxID=2528003 RepID=A0A5C6CZR1_9BACT|nr:sigma-70 family RNA polymerase sigma factor [Bythopirellula polymerisocia]TWU30132.1 ECF RNA polymerase sigma-E factor [Bythopirellula polymerisocia]